MTGLRRRALAAVVVVLTVVLSGCGSDGDEVRGFIADHYQRVSDSGNYAKYESDDDGDAVAAAISSAVSPGREHSDGGSHYLGYKDVMVNVTDNTVGGSTIEVTDAKDGYDRWGLAIIPIWGTYGGSYSSGFSGGGSGSGGK